jgi:hypothetical protein
MIIVTVVHDRHGTKRPIHAKRFSSQPPIASKSSCRRIGIVLFKPVFNK